MSNHRRSSRARAALALVPLAAALAGAGCSARKTPPRPLARPPVSDTASVAIGEGKSIEHMLEGRFPGVNILRTDGGGLQIRIRGGNSSFFGNEEPLYIVDDVAVPVGSRGILYINPYDIEKIEVLKNAQDTALYGVRGSNGVVKITTKRAKPR